MYYIVYGLLYLFSLLPFFIIYALSDCIYFIVYHIAGYRKQIVFGNLRQAFPDKSEKEITAIAKKFYSSFIDNFLETVKSISMSDAEIDKRCTGNAALIDELTKKGRNIQLLGAHMFNWEYANFFLSRNIHIPFMSMYSKIENKIFDRLFLKLRSKYNTILIPTSSYNRRAMELMKKQYCMYLISDQTPGNPQNAFWLNFLNAPAPFINGPEKTAAKNNTAIIMINFKKIKRGHYYFDCEKLIENPAKFTPQELTIQYRNFVEDIIHRQPENYLWSHRRWKWNYTEEFHHIWIDKN